MYSVQATHGLRRGVEYLISVRLFQVVQVHPDIEIDEDEEGKVCDALATLLPRNVELRELSIGGNMGMDAACCAALAHLTALTMLNWQVAADTSDEVHAGQENAPQVLPQHFKRAQMYALLASGTAHMW